MQLIMGLSVPRVSAYADIFVLQDTCTFACFNSVLSKENDNQM
jgi:hypothetical protein